jgi:uncharacterized protein (UPF0179 family)
VSLTADAADTDGSIAQVAFYAGAILIETDTTAPYEASWIPAAPGTYTLTARATDNGNLTAISAPVSVTVNPASSNHPPQLDPIPNRTVDEGTALAFTATASDPDPETVLTFSLIGAPPGATIDPVSGAFAWTPNEDQGPGSYAIVVRVRDNAVPPASDDETVVVTVNEVNQAPTLLPIADRSVNEGSPVALTATATDPDRPANLLTFTLTEAPAGATIDPASGAFSWTPTEAQGGASYRVTMRVADNGNPGLAAATSFNVAVAKVNQAPILATLSNKTVAEGTILTFTASATDADLPPNAMAFSLVTAPAGAAIDPVTGVFTWTPSLGDLGPHTVTVAVTDDGTPPLSAQRTFTATVTGRPDLILTGLSASTAVVAPGGTLSASSSVKNQGASAAGAFVIGFHFSGDGGYGGPDDVAFPQARSLTSLGAGATSTGSVSLTVPANTPLGPYVLCAMADEGAALPETNEANNTRCTTGVVQVSRPDLVISAMTANAAAVNAGGKLSVTDTLRNQGLVAAGSSRVGYRLTMNQVLGDADDVAPATTRTVSSLSAGASNQATLNLTIPATAPAGSYYVCAGADVLGAVTEIDETNNVRCATTLVQVRQPNLVTSALSTTATTVAAGASFVLSNTVTNASSMSAGGFVISFSLSGGPAYGGADDVTISQTRSRSSLGAGNSTSASTTLTVPSGTPPGSYYVCAFADSGQVVFESSEADNTACTGSTIVVP